MVEELHRQSRKGVVAVGRRTVRGGSCKVGQHMQGQDREGAVAVQERPDQYYVKVVKGQLDGLEETLLEGPGTVVLVEGTGFGHDDPSLGRLLLKQFLSAVAHGGMAVIALILVNEGVRLAAEGSDVLDSLVALEKQGAEIVVCETSLNHLDLRGRLSVGTAAPMYRIADLLLHAKRTVTI